jgi:hypothetical protein
MSTEPVETYRGVVMTRLFSALQHARFNELYYRKRASMLRKFSTSANLLSALAASTVLTGLLKEGAFGVSPVLWPALTALAAIGAAVAPVMHWDSKASQLETAAFCHGLVRDRLHQLLRELRLTEIHYGHMDREAEILAFQTGLAALDENPSDHLISKCWDQTLRELPSDQAWVIA